MNLRESDIAIIGGGLGGLTAAALLQAAGFKVNVYEQAKGFSRIGAGIHLGPNLVRVLKRTKVAERLVQKGVRPKSAISRKHDTGEVMLDYTLGAEGEARYGAPYLITHRGDFHAELLSAVPVESVQFGKRLVDLDPTRDRIRLGFADGTTAEADIVIGADGVRSRVRKLLIGLEGAKFAQSVAYRTIFPVSLLPKPPQEDYIKWWAADRVFLEYYITSSRDVYYFVAVGPQSEWNHETASVPADLEELRSAFADFHPDVQSLLSTCPSASKWAQFDSEPLPLWSRGRIVLLGDACHPMTPYMGQGAAMAIEDAAMLTRCLEESPTDFEVAFRLYETKRKSRTTAIASESRKNKFLKDHANADWVFGYDVTTDPLKN